MALLPGDRTVASPGSVPLAKLRLVASGWATAAATRQPSIIDGAAGAFSTTADRPIETLIATPK
jgi:hypothetical protein